VSRPLIGVTTSEVRLAEHSDPLPEGDPPQREMALGMVYMRSIERAGGIPVVLPPLGHDTIAPTLERLDGVCLSGGPDIDPKGYGEEERDPQLGTTEPTLDGYELALAQLADARGMPVLGICRGVQTLNVARGGTLHQHLEGHRQTEAGRVTTHSVRIEPGSRLARVMGVTEAEVNSFHHQAADRLGHGLRAVAWAPDGLVEGLEATARRSTSACSGTPSRSSTARSTARCSASWSRRPRPGARPGDASGMTTRHWRTGTRGREAPWTVGVEEEVMLLEPRDWSLDLALGGGARRRCRTDMIERTAAETHGSALELATEPHADIRSATRSCATCAASLASVLEPLGIRAAVAGTHPFTLWEDVEVSPGARYQFLYSSMRELARREPTFGLHVHVAVPNPEMAVRSYNRMRAHLPMLLALAGNSPFWQGRDTGLCSMRTPLFQAFPRVGIPRPVPLLRRLRRGHRRAAALRRVPGADVPVVGRAAAAALRDARGAGDGRADAGRRHRGDRGARAVPGAARGARGSRRPTRLVTRPEVLEENPLHRRARRHGRRS
jgi:putative glutamine amidotransferase